MTGKIAATLFALNAFLCWPLFHIEYLDAFQSDEGSWITFARFLRQYWPHISWFPWYDAGMPFENTYLPGVSAVTALLSLLGHCSPAHAFHFLSALAYSLAPVFLFLFAARVSGRIAPSAIAAVAWSLFSPSVIFPALLQEMGTPWGLRRLRDIVYWGDTPHNVAMCLLPVSLLFTWRCLDRPAYRNFALATFAAAAVMITNAFGLVVVCVSSGILFLTSRPTRKTFAAVAGIQLSAYLLVCRLLPPSLIRLMQINSQSSGGDFRFTSRSVLLAGGFLALLTLLWASTRRLSDPILRFAILFSACFGGITLLGYAGINLVPQPLRYHLEMEPAICLLAAFLIPFNRIPWKAVAAVAIVPILWLINKDAQFARHLIRPVTIATSLPFRQAHWMAANLPGQRVLDASEGQFLFNVFADNPQLSAGHEPTAPNWIQRIAIFTIYTGQNAGAQDAAISILWLKAFSCGAIVVPGPTSPDHYHAIANPVKFDGLLPKVWNDSGDVIYQLPASSLAHVIPRSAVVAHRPENGLDVAELRPYVAALEAETTPPVMQWDQPNHARISAPMNTGDLLSIQINYDRGWEARVEGRKVSLTADGLGLIVIDPGCTNCSIDLAFKGGPERTVAALISVLTFLTVVGLLFVPKQL